MFWCPVCVLIDWWWSSWLIRLADETVDSLVPGAGAAEGGAGEADPSRARVQWLRRHSHCAQDAQREATGAPLSQKPVFQGERSLSGWSVDPCFLFVDLPPLPHWCLLNQGLFWCRRSLPFVGAIARTVSASSQRWVLTQQMVFRLASFAVSLTLLFWCLLLFWALGQSQVDWSVYWYDLIDGSTLIHLLVSVVCSFILFIHKNVFVQLFVHSFYLFISQFNDGMDGWIHS